MALVWVTTLLPRAAVAQVGRINGPLVTREEWRLLYNLVDYVDNDPALNHDLRQRLGLEYSFTDKWAAEAGAEWRRSELDSLNTEGVFFELKRELMDQNDGWWLSTGAKISYLLNTSGEPDGIEGRLLFQKEHTGGNFRHQANLLFAGELGQGASDGVAVGTRWNSRWNAHRNARPGFEWHAAWGHIDRLNASQGQYLGPAVHGDVFRAGRVSVTYEAAYVFGLTEASRDGAFRFRLETVF